LLLLAEEEKEKEDDNLLDESLLSLPLLLGSPKALASNDPPLNDAHGAVEGGAEWNTKSEAVEEPVALLVSIIGTS